MEINTSIFLQVLLSIFHMETFSFFVYCVDIPSVFIYSTIASKPLNRRSAPRCHRSCHGNTLTESPSEGKSGEKIVQ